MTMLIWTTRCMGVVPLKSTRGVACTLPAWSSIYKTIGLHLRGPIPTVSDNLENSGGKTKTLSILTKPSTGSS